MALSEDGKARAGMGVDAGDFANTGRPGLAITNFEGEMIGLYRGQDKGIYRDVTIAAGLGSASRTRLGFGCLFADLDLDGSLDLIVANGHIDDTVRNIRGNAGYAQAPHLFLNRGGGTFRDVASEVGSGFALPRVGRGLACGDFDRDGDVDLLITTNSGPPVLFRNDQVAGRRSVRFRLAGVKSNRDAHRRDDPDLPRRHVADANGEERVELPVAVRAARDIRSRHPRSRRARRRRLAERPNRGVQGSRHGQGLRRYRRQRHQLLTGRRRPIHAASGGSGGHAATSVSLRVFVSPWFDFVVLYSLASQDRRRYPLGA